MTMDCHVVKGKSKACRARGAADSCFGAGIRPWLHAVPQPLQRHAFHRAVNHDSKTSQVPQSLAVKLFRLAGLHNNCKCAVAQHGSVICAITITPDNHSAFMMCSGVVKARKCCCSRRQYKCNSAAECGRSAGNGNVAMPKSS